GVVLDDLAGKGDRHLHLDVGDGGHLGGALHAEQVTPVRVDDPEVLAFELAYRVPVENDLLPVEFAAVVDLGAGALRHVLEIPLDLGEPLLDGPAFGRQHRLVHGDDERPVERVVIAIDRNIHIQLHAAGQRERHNNERYQCAKGTHAGELRPSCG